MGNVQIERFDSAPSLAAGVAERWLAELGSQAGNGPPFIVALCGGRIARDLFSNVAARAVDCGTSLAEVEFFWGDERCVPPENGESNYRAAVELLLAPMSVSLARLHRIRGEAPPEVAAREAAAELLRIAPANAAGQPVLDLVFLGMGEDGHIASLFPGESEVVMNSPEVYRPVTASKPPPQRITLGYSALAAAREVWVLASGTGKAVALRESLKPAGGTPLARLLRVRARTVVFTDIAG